MNDLDKRLIENFRRGLTKAFPHVNEYPAAVAPYDDETRAMLKEIGRPDESIGRALMEVAAPKIANTRLEWFTTRTNMISAPHSPLEGVCAIALAVVAECHTGFEPIVGQCRDGKHRDFRLPEEPEVVSICGQHSIADYHADFFVVGYVQGNRVRSVAVEVDGHEFHERTKEQAKRDRERDRTMQKYGFVVFRYTGSELYADPIKCAMEVVRMALGQEG